MIISRTEIIEAFQIIGWVLTSPNILEKPDDGGEFSKGDVVLLPDEFNHRKYQGILKCFFEEAADFIITHIYEVEDVNIKYRKPYDVFENLSVGNKDGNILAYQLGSYIRDVLGFKAHSLSMDGSCTLSKSKRGSVKIKGGSHEASDELIRFSFDKTVEYIQNDMSNH